MSSIVRPSMSGANRLTSHARANGPSAASINTAMTSHTKTMRSSGASSNSSATARNAATMPLAVSTCTAYARAGRRTGKSRSPDHLLGLLALIGIFLRLGLLFLAIGLVAQREVHREVVAADELQPAQLDQTEVEPAHTKGNHPSSANSNAGQPLVRYPTNKATQKLSVSLHADS